MLLSGPWIPHRDVISPSESPADAHHLVALHMDSSWRVVALKEGANTSPTTGAPGAGSRLTLTTGASSADGSLSFRMHSMNVVRHPLLGAALPQRLLLHGPSRSLLLLARTPPAAAAAPEGAAAAGAPCGGDAEDNNGIPWSDFFWEEELEAAVRGGPLVKERRGRDAQPQHSVKLLHPQTGERGTAMLDVENKARYLDHLSSHSLVSLPLLSLPFAASCRVGAGCLPVRL